MEREERDASRWHVGEGRMLGRPPTKRRFYGKYRHAYLRRCWGRGLHFPHMVQWSSLYQKHGCSWDGVNNAFISIRTYMHVAYVPQRAKKKHMHHVVRGTTTDLTIYPPPFSPRPSERILASQRTQQPLTRMCPSDSCHTPGGPTLQPVRGQLKPTCIRPGPLPPAPPPFPPLVRTSQPQ